MNGNPAYCEKDQDTDYPTEAYITVLVPAARGFGLGRRMVTAFVRIPFSRSHSGQKESQAQEQAGQKQRRGSQSAAVPWLATRILSVSITCMAKLHR